LANTKKLKGKVVSFFSVFGRVPFFYYIIHIYVIDLTCKWSIIVAMQPGSRLR